MGNNDSVFSFKCFGNFTYFCVFGKTVRIK